MYSAHDTNVAEVMGGLNLTNYKCLMDKYFNKTTESLNCNNRPYFAASILIELHSDMKNNI